MPETTPPQAPAPPESPPPAAAPGGYPLGALVVALYVVAVAAVFVGFAAYITRTTWETNIIEASNGKTSLDNLVFLVRREELLQEQIKTEQDLVRETDKLIDAAQAEVERLKAAVKVAQQEQGAIKSIAVARFESSRNLFTDADAARLDDILQADSTEGPSLERLLVFAQSASFNYDAEKEKTDAFTAALASANERFDTLRKDLNELENQLRIADSGRDRHLEARSPPLKRIAGLETKLAAVQKKVPLDSANRAQLGSLKGVFGGAFFVGLVSMPTIFLTLLVTIAAGGLGTVVAFSRNYRNSTGGAISASRLFVSLGEGIAAAIAIFLFAGAGMLVLTEGGGQNDRLELSPYLVAFIAFLSGFMAEAAFARIQQAGNEFFKTDGKNGGKNPSPPPDGPPPGDDGE